MIIVWYLVLAGNQLTHNEIVLPLLPSPLQHMITSIPHLSSHLTSSLSLSALSVCSSCSILWALSRQQGQPGITGPGSSSEIGFVKSADIREIFLPLEEWMIAYDSITH